MKFFSYGVMPEQSIDTRNIHILCRSTYVHMYMPTRLRKTNQAHRAAKGIDRMLDGTQVILQQNLICTQPTQHASFLTARLH